MMSNTKKNGWQQQQQEETTCRNNATLGDGATGTFRRSLGVVFFFTTRAERGTERYVCLGFRFRAVWTRVVHSSPHNLTIFHLFFLVVLAVWWPLAGWPDFAMTLSTRLSKKLKKHSLNNLV